MTARLPKFARFAAAVTLVAPVLAAATSAFAPTTSSAAAAPAYQNTATFDYQAAKQTFTVPPAVTQVFFEMNGAAGGRGGATGLIAGGAPGHGAEVTGTVNVNPGDTIDVFTGESGFDGSAGNSQAAGAWGGGFPNTQPGANGGSSSGATVAGTGGGGGAASELDYHDTLLALAGGGGGGGGGGGIAGYNGGDGGTGGVSGRGGTGGTGPGAGSGGGTLSCASQGGSRAGTTGSDGTQQGGGGGGGAGGYDGTTCGGHGGSGGGVGAGGGGGGGAGASFVDSQRVVGSQFFSSPVATPGSVTFTWAQPTSSVSMTATSYGKVAQLSATVAPANGITTPTPTGTVDFVQSIYGADYTIGSATLNGGVATLVTSNLSQGTYSIYAKYEGDGVYAPSSKFITFTFSPAVITTVLSGKPNAIPVPWGSPGTLTATIAAPAGTPSWYPSPTGMVSFYDTTGSTRSWIGSLTLGAGDGNVANMPYSWTKNAPAYSFEIDYAGDNNYSAATTSFDVGVTPSVLSTTTLTSTRNPIVTGQTVTFTATVKPASGTSVPTGTVTFYDAATLTFGAPPAGQQLGTVALGANGTASLTTNGNMLYGGENDIITATYGGDTHMQGSTVNLTLPVNTAAAPTANAGPAQTVTSGGSTTVDGSASTDPQGEPLTYAWTQLDGPSVTIEDKSAAKTKVTAPTTNSKVVAHLGLTVTNGAGLSSTSVVAITINPK